MNQFSAVLWSEFLKVKKSRIFPGSIVFFIFVSSMMALIMFIQIYPQIAGKLGMIGNKASMMRFGEPNWPNYFNLLIQGIAGVGLVGIGFITSWIFGREFSENTIKDILVLPISREFFVISKSIVIIIWSVILALAYFIAGIVAGVLIGLPGLSIKVIADGGYIYLITVLLSIPLFTPVAFFASYSRGYILPLGVVIVTLIIANFSGLVGLGPYFPWAIPGLFGIQTGIKLHFASYLILLFTVLTGLCATIAHWKYADQK
jgi:ABC-type transport system involved in multi-copper enzyme maturation permease subunit